MRHGDSFDLVTARSICTHQSGAKELLTGIADIVTAVIEYKRRYQTLYGGFGYASEILSNRLSTSLQSSVHIVILSFYTSMAKKLRRNLYRDFSMSEKYTGKRKQHID